MKKTAQLILFMGTLASLTALGFAQEPAKVGGRAAPAPKAAAAQAPTVDENPHAELDRLLEALGQKAASGPISKEEIASLRTALAASGADPAGNPRAVRLRARLDTAIADLEARAGKAELKKEDLLSLREQLVDMRLDRALDQIEARAKAGALEPQMLARLQGLLEHRAELVRASGDAEASAQETALQAKVALATSELQKRALGAIEPKDLQALREPILEHRLGRALARLEGNALAKRATDADVGAVKDILEDRGQLNGDSAESQAILQRYLMVVEGMRQKATEGKLTREEFAQLKAQLTMKAREAASGK